MNLRGPPSAPIRAARSGPRAAIIDAQVHSKASVGRRGAGHLHAPRRKMAGRRPGPGRRRRARAKGHPALALIRTDIVNQAGLVRGVSRPPPPPPNRP